MTIGARNVLPNPPLLCRRYAPIAQGSPYVNVVKSVTAAPLSGAQCFVGIVH